jgi:Cu/Ag efflux protein CusF
MKKLILLTLLAFVFFSVSSSLALTIKTKSSPSKAKPGTTSTSTATTTKPVKQPDAEAKKVAGAYEKCLNLEMKNLTKEMQSRKKTAREEYKNAVKNNTSTEAK